MGGIRALNMDVSFDRQHIWHPYTDMAHPDPVFPVVGAQGCLIELEDGRQLIDGMSSWWTAIHGYNHPQLNAALIQQADKMSHVMFGGLTHEPAIRLAQQLVDITDNTLQHVFFADSGSVAVEVALKMAAQLAFARGQTSKDKFVTFRKGYHGDTFGAMSVCDPIDGMHQAFAPLLNKHIFLDSPHSGFNRPLLDEDIQPFKDVLQRRHEEIIAVIFEPVVQNAGGMNIYAPEYLRQVRALCDQYQIPLIFDEIATGFGRTGKLFAYQHAGVAPDILCLGKALTGGMMTLSAVVCRSDVALGIESRFMHGPTYMANPLACAVASASIDLLHSYDWQSEIQRIEKQLCLGLEPCRVLTPVKDVRVLGSIGVVELHQSIDLNTLPSFFVEKGVWIRPFRNLIYLMPPYVINDEQLHVLCTAIQQAIEEVLC
ncbi:adenosylmethionine--8-amino-7-oxononanoate transaminase [Marinicella sp. W31]|uniref:adenosylmethionine--8-amino-7-oxononanoate transaminase n=1 Tax=Marinicella sp. W31 TaxID=3023713 RepID=UPI0037568E57